jgi:hypothetical protein
MTRGTRLLTILSTALIAVLLSRPALAGPPLLCFPFDIGNARTLPMGHGDWHAVDPRYDVSHLVTDTLGLLTPGMPVIVRMETLRRATIYAAPNPEMAKALMTELRARADAKVPLAAFDLGYLSEALLEAEAVFKQLKTSAR